MCCEADILEGKGLPKVATTVQAFMTAYNIQTNYKQLSAVWQQGWKAPSRCNELYEKQTKKLDIFFMVWWHELWILIMWREFEIVSEMTLTVPSTVDLWRFYDLFMMAWLWMACFYLYDCRWRYCSWIIVEEMRVLEALGRMRIWSERGEKMAA